MQNGKTLLNHKYGDKRRMKRIRRLLNKIRLLTASPKGIIKFYQEQGMRIGGNCEINKNVNIITEPYLITLGNNVRITSGVKFITHDGGLYVARNYAKGIKKICPNIERADKFGKITIGNNVHIGVDTIIMPGITNNVVVGAGAVVTKDIPDNVIAVGVPAKPIETIDEYVKKNMDKFVYTKNLSYEEKKKILLE